MSVWPIFECFWSHPVESSSLARHVVLETCSHILFTSRKSKVSDLYLDIVSSTADWLCHKKTKILLYFLT